MLLGAGRGARRPDRSRTTSASACSRTPTRTMAATSVLARPVKDGGTRIQRAPSDESHCAPSLPPCGRALPCRARWAATGRHASSRCGACIRCCPPVKPIGFGCTARALIFLHPARGRGLDRRRRLLHRHVPGRLWPVRRPPRPGLHRWCHARPDLQRGLICSDADKPMRTYTMPGFMVILADPWSDCSTEQRGQPTGSSNGANLVRCNSLHSSIKIGVV